MKIFSYLCIALQFLLVNSILASNDLSSQIDTLEKFRFIKSDSVLNEIDLLQQSKISESDRERLNVIKASIFSYQRKPDLAFDILDAYINQSSVKNKLALADAYLEIDQIFLSNGS